MPSYVFDLTVTAGTEADAPAETILLVPVGVIQRVEFMFPPGPQAEVGVRMLVNDTQVYPSQTGQWIAWDGGIVSANLDYDVPQGENLVKVQGRSPGANFDHTITVKVDVSTEALVLEGSVMLDIESRLQQVLGGT